jgi:hypothetical protein
MTRPSGSNFSLCVTGLTLRKHGCASQPLDAAHGQPPLLAARSSLSATNLSG